MHRNTILTLGILAIIATLVVGIRIGQIFSPHNQTPTPISSDNANNIFHSPSALNYITEQKKYIHQNCGISLQLDSNITITEASDAAQLTNPETGEKINLICGSDFPKPPLSPEKIEVATIAGERATIYHDANSKDGTPLDVVVFTHPKRKIQIALFGFGETFKRITSSLKLSQ